MFRVLEAAVMLKEEQKRGEKAGSRVGLRRTVSVVSPCSLIISQKSLF